MVKPWQPVATDSAIKLSLLDQVHLNIPVTMLLVFEHPINKAPAETIQRALSQSLVHYYPISGRIPAGADEIHCTGEGVVFVAASADCSLEKSKLLLLEQPSASSPAGATSRALLDDLAVYYDDGGCAGGPLMLVQVTEFSCGGFVVGVTWNHGVGDTAGIAQFLQAVGEMARGMSSPSVIPNRNWDDSLVPSLSPSVVAAIQQKQQQQQQQSMAYEPQWGELVFLDVTIRSSLINRIKTEYDLVHRSYGQSSPCSTFEAVVAVLWRCRTRAIMSPSSSLSSPAVLSFAVNIRKYVGAEEGYYGNGIAATGQKVVSTVGAVANGNIVDIVKAIKDAKAGIPDMLKSSNSSSKQQLVDRYTMLAVSSWGNLGLDKPDFGSGVPRRVIFHKKPLASPHPFGMMCLPWKGIAGASVMSLYVKKEHADAFLAELASLNT
ncbi:hypothetical protein EJB05_34722, partial [Eragrostis curvula]